MTVATDKWHGTYGGYTNHGCRCGDCRDAGTRHRAEYLSDPVNRATHAAGGAANYAKNREKRRAQGRDYYASGRQRDLRYGLEPGDFDALLQAQGNRCAICRTVFSGTPNLDHDHSCCSRGSCGNCIRGLLCDACNKGLGQFADDPERLLQAVEYLKNTQKGERR